jgi:hypothetical protein
MTFDMLREQGAKGEVTQDEADVKRPGRPPGTQSGTSMTADEHIPRKKYAVSADEAYRDWKSRGEIAEKEAARRTTRRNALKEKPPTRTDISERMALPWGGQRT